MVTLEETNSHGKCLKNLYFDTCSLCLKTPRKRSPLIWGCSQNWNLTALYSRNGILDFKWRERKGYFLGNWFFLTLSVFHYLRYQRRSPFNQHMTTKCCLLVIAALLVLLIKAKCDSGTQTHGWASNLLWAKERMTFPTLTKGRQISCF